MRTQGSVGITVGNMLAEKVIILFCDPTDQMDGANDEDDGQYSSS